MLRINLWHTLPALLRSQDGRVKRRERFAFVGRGELASFLPRLTAAEGVVSMPPSEGGGSRITQSSRETTRARLRGNVGAGSKKHPEEGRWWWHKVPLDEGSGSKPRPHCVSGWGTVLTV